MIGLNSFNSNESALVFANENSAWAKSCVGKTSNNNKVCSECMKVLKSSAIRKKPNVFAMITKSQNHQNHNLNLSHFHYTLLKQGMLLEKLPKMTATSRRNQHITNLLTKTTVIID